MSRIRKALINRSGEVRLGWLLALAAIMYALAVGGVYYLYWYAYRTMMDIWGVTSENIARAPGAVQFLYGWSNVIVQLIQSALVVCAAAALGYAAGLGHEKGKGFAGQMGRGAGLGAACIAVLWGVLMLTGSVRQGWRMSRPDVSINTFALLLTTLSAAAAEGTFLYGTMRRILKKRLPVGAALVVMVVINVLIAIFEGTLTPTALINSALTALVCCLLAERSSTAAVVGFRFAWAYLDQAVFGFAGATAALYETYPVNRYWLNGGNAGIMNGVMATVALLTLAGWLARGKIVLRLPLRKEKSKSPS